MTFGIEQGNIRRTSQEPTGRVEFLGRVRLITYGSSQKNDAILRSRNCLDVHEYDIRDCKLQPVIEEMFQIIKDPERLGIGLAAPQVGIEGNFFIIDWLGFADPKKHPSEVESLATDALSGKAIAAKKLVVINPKIMAVSSTLNKMDEGCLSIPGKTVNVPRPDWVEAKFHDLDFKEYHYKMTGLLGKCFQHEFDHIRGKLILDYAPVIKRSPIFANSKKKSKR